MKKILFIINPVSGVGKQKKVIKLIPRILDQRIFSYKIEYTKNIGHAIEIAKSAISNYEIIVAVGGDGIVNEISHALIDTETKNDYIEVSVNYCIPTYSTGTSDGDYISLVQLGDIDNSTGALSSPYYYYYSTLSTDLAQGASYTITLSAGTYSSGNNISVWIDFNHDGTFASSEKLGNVTLGAMPEIDDGVVIKDIISF